jgi:hypothetical protein
VNLKEEKKQNDPATDLEHHLKKVASQRKMRGNPNQIQWVLS